MASFRTGYLQREIVVDAAVEATVEVDSPGQSALSKAFAARQANPATLTALKVGDMVTLTPATGDKPMSIERTLSLATATHIIAQGDMTMEMGHVPVEHRDYRYFPMVNGTYTGTLTSDTKVKKVALFKITNKEDVIIDASQGETV